MYDVDTQTVISSLVDPLFAFYPSVIWSPIDPKLIIIGGKAIKIWSTDRPPITDNGNVKKIFVNVLVSCFLTSEILKKVKSDLKITAPQKESEKKTKIKVELKTTNKKQNWIVPNLYASTDENFKFQVDVMRSLMTEDGENTNQPNSSDLFKNKQHVLDLMSKNCKWLLNHS